MDRGHAERRDWDVLLSEEAARYIERLKAQPTMTAVDQQWAQDAPRGNPDSEYGSETSTDRWPSLGLNSEEEWYGLEAQGD